MRVREKFTFPEEKRGKENKARRLEYWTIFFLLTIVVVMYYTMGSSQAMKTAWIEDVLSLIPPIAFLIASHQRGKGPDDRYPYGRERVMALSFAGAAVALTILALYMLYDSAMGLLTTHHPTIGHRTIFGIRMWSGWFMIIALVYSAIPPLVLGRMKLPLARDLHEKTLKADADMNRADWMTAAAAVLGILGIGIGWWWADSVAALIISLDVLKDGLTNTAAVFSDLMNKRPTTGDGSPDDEVVDESVRALKTLDWVRDADVRLHEEGAVIAGEAFVVPAGQSVTLEQLQEAAAVVHAVDWKIYDVVVTAVPSVERRRDPDGETTMR